MITITKRNALGTPFQYFDCHIPNHSPPMVMKPTCQSRKPSVEPDDRERLGAIERARIGAQAAQQRDGADPAQHRRQRLGRDDERIGQRAAAPDS